MPGGTANTGFRNDQFYNFGDSSTGEGSNAMATTNTAGVAVRGADNPPFVYPDRLVRTHDHNGMPIATPLKRGYIRSLLTWANGQNVPLRKCQFQFNPTNITQSVDANTSMLNFLQQDPAQYAQPMPANVNLTFNLMFDRSMELNNPKGGVNTTREGAADPWAMNDPSQVGVLRDLADFYAVIGQGLSSAQMSYVTKVLNDQIVAEANAAQDQTQATADLAAAQSSIPDFLRMNLANSAFLLPMPVRVVFSSLYIVEGLVTNTTVTFTKFNTAMVPMQCALTVTMEAKYIGFAKKDTFFTYVLEKREEQERRTLQEAEDAKKAMYDAFASVAGKMTVGPILNTDEAYRHGSFVEDDSVTSILSLLENKYTPFNIGFFLPNASGKNDNIGKQFDTSTPPFIVTGAEVTVYGPFNDLSNFRGDLGAYAKANGRVLLSGKLHATNSQYGSATTKDEWDKMARDGAVTKGTNFGSANGYVSGPTTYDPTLKWHVVHVTGFVQAKIGSERIKGDGDGWFAVRADETQTLSRTISLKWPSYTPVEYTSTTTTTPSSTSGTVPPDNTATKPKQPGSTSSVGAGGVRYS